jgi:ELWxxDGT repeat protein
MKKFFPGRNTMRRSCFLPVLLLLGWGLPASAAEPTLVQDVNPTPAVSDEQAATLRQFVSVGPRAVFVLSHQGPIDYGGELWASDGTNGGTVLLRSFVSTRSAVQILGSDGRLAFALVTTTGAGYTQTSVVWRTDGTGAGTFPVTGPLRGASPGVQALVTPGHLFFAGCAEESGCEPWVSDGTAAGTRRLRDLTPGTYGSNPRQLVAMGGRVFFFADTPAGPGLWQTDGTRPGTRRVAALSPYANPKTLVAAGSRMYFTTGSSSNNLNALWTSDGTEAGTRPVPPFARARGRGPAATQLLGSAGGLEYFLGIHPAVGWQLYRTDGTPEGTLRLTSFAGPPLFLDTTASLDGRFLFVGPDGALWTSDGTRAGTGPLSGCAGGCPPPESHSGLAVSGGLAFFSGRIAGSSGQGYEPWVTDGTPGGTRQIADLCAGGCGSSPLFFGPVIHGQVLFYAGGNLWGTDGTAGGTRLLATGAVTPSEILTPVVVAAAGPRLVFAGFDKDSEGKVIPGLKSTEGTPESELTLDLRLTAGGGSDPRGFTALGDKVLFFACSPLGGIWATGGTPETTVPLTDARDYCGDTTLHFVVLDGIAYFKALRPGDYWHELWRTDGTPAGTYAISHMGPEQEVDTLAVFRGRLLLVTSFIDNDATKVHSAIWTSDGTAAGTAQVFDLAVRYVREIHILGDAVYFVGQNADYATAIFRSDGTAAGTRELARIGQDTQATDFQQIGGQVFFLVRYFANGDLWRTDGTPEGTRQFVPNGSRVAYVQGLAQLGGRLYFIGLDVTDPSLDQGVPALFRSDGTVAGTVRIKTFSLDDNNLIPYFPAPLLMAAGGSLYFVAADGAHGSELWRSDGTTAGTVLVKDIRPGPDSSRISEMTPAGDRIFFAADDGEHGIELWTSDGTAAGTRQVADLSAGPTSSAPRELTPLGSRLFFSADDGVVGREPWVLPLDSTLVRRIAP